MLTNKDYLHSLREKLWNGYLWKKLCK